VQKTTTVRGGARLPERTGATATAVGRKVYVFGGQDPTRGVCFNDVVVLDCNSWEWSRLEVTGASPPPRSSHSACVVNGGRLLVVYGGAGEEDGPLGDVHVLDLREGAERWTRPRVGGQSPEPREMHAACMIPAAGLALGCPPARDGNSGGGGDGGEGEKWSGDHEMMVVGGRGRGGVLRDVVVLDTRAMAWVRRGDAGRAICAHTAVPWVITRGAGATGTGAALVFGGFTGAALHGNELVTVEGSTLTTGVLGSGTCVTEVEAGGGWAGLGAVAPEPRFAHAAVALPPSMHMPRGAMLVFAGVTPAFDLNDLAMWVNEDPAAAPAAGAPSTAATVTVTAAVTAAAATSPAPLPAAVPACDLD
jgi:hypothetical protein